MPGGRPTIYEERFCEMLIEHMEKGFSYESFAGLIGVSKQTIYDWEKANPQFLDSKKIGVEKSRLFWETQGIEGVYTTETFEQDENGSKSTKKALNSSVWIFNMKNRFKDEWRDKQETDLNVNEIQIIRPLSPREKLAQEESENEGQD